MIDNKEYPIIICKKNNIVKVALEENHFKKKIHFQDIKELRQFKEVDNRE